MSGVAKPTDHVFRVEVSPPGAQAPAPWYSQNVVAKDGTARVALPLALNDAPGKWTVLVREVATGVIGRATASVAP